MNNEAQINAEAYRTEEAIEKYSHYGLYPNERYLFEKYFSKDKFILDLACGAGRTTLRLNELGYQVKGVDLSDKLIEIARTRFPSIRFETGNYCDIQEYDASVDNILISHNGLDYAYPETQRIKAISECARVIKQGGYFIFSGHNIKSLHFSPYYLKGRCLWLMKNTIRAFYNKAYIYDLGMYTFYSSPSYCANQVVNKGFELKEIIGFRNSNNLLFNKYISPYNHFVFQKI
ncbi:MAG TPA: class I SAM-dependent methyltransferase [Flavitalea sp.]|nr:class I SAM-dependent methyltransferase [Flavitalea sp.]